MKILSIETSCDETSMAVCEIVENNESKTMELFYHGVHSQINIHKEFGGVFPNVARREHQENSIPMLLQALASYPHHIPCQVTDSQQARIRDMLAREERLFLHLEDHVMRRAMRPDLDIICVTNGPGLEPALWVGVHLAQALGILWNIPVIPVNHMDGHILSTLIDPTLATIPYNQKIPLASLDYPTLSLLISGGHTELVSSTESGMYTKLGKTRDDAVGEAFDKVARLLDLPYPGGPEVSRLAREYTHTLPRPEFPRPMIHSDDYDFSFSGLKTAVLYHIKTYTRPLTMEDKQGIAYAFEEAVTDVLVHKTKKALDYTQAQTLIVAGGVSANKKIISALDAMCSAHYPTCTLRIPHRTLTGDNALMIALAGYMTYTKSPHASFEDIRALGRLSL